MRRLFKGRAGLLALNVALLGVLAALTWVPWAQGQPQNGPRARGEYTMVSGKTTAGGPSAVYIIDSSNQEMVALRWDQGKQSLMGLGYRNISGDGRTAPPGR